MIFFYIIPIYLQYKLLALFSTRYSLEQLRACPLRIIFICLSNQGTFTTKTIYIFIQIYRYIHLHRLSLWPVHPSPTWLQFAMFRRFFVVCSSSHPIMLIHRILVYLKCEIKYINLYTILYMGLWGIYINYKKKTLLAWSWNLWKS